MRWLLCVAMGALIMTSDATAAESGRITGLGGVFLKSKDPKALTAWYRDVLGIQMESWGGAMLRYDAPGHPPMVVFSTFAADSGYFDPSKRETMINFAVD